MMLASSEELWIKFKHNVSHGAERHNAGYQVYLCFMCKLVDVFLRLAQDDEAN